MKEKAEKILRAVPGGLLALALLPIYAVGAVICGAALLLREFWESFAKDLVLSVVDPDYVPPIGMGGCYATQCYAREAVRAEAAGNEAEAVKYRKKGAFLFDPFAMLGLARHYEHAGDGKQAAEWYALAASFDNAEGEARYADLTGLSLDRKEKRRLRKDFIYGRRFSLRD